MFTFSQIAATVIFLAMSIVIIGWGRTVKYALPSMIIVVAVCHILLVVRYT